MIEQKKWEEINIRYTEALREIQDLGLKAISNNTRTSYLLLILSVVTAVLIVFPNQVLYGVAIPQIAFSLFFGTVGIYIAINSKKRQKEFKEINKEFLQAGNEQVQRLVKDLSNQQTDDHDEIKNKTILH